MAYDHESSSYVSPRLARRRKRARAAFWVVFTIIVLAGVGAAAALIGGGDDSDGDKGVAVGDTTTLAPGVTTTLAPGVTTTLAPGAPTTTVKGGKRVPTTTLPALPPPKPFKITASTGVNVREGPATSYKVIGTVQTGVEVLVVCVIDGESVDSPLGPSTKWVRVTFNTEGGDTLTGYVSAPYVALGPALNDTTIVGLCPNI